MNFQRIGKVEDYKFYLDVAFGRASKSISEIRSKIKDNDRLNRMKKAEIARIEIVRNTLMDSFEKIIESFPRTEKLPEFYIELMKASFDFSEFKKSLGAVKWASNKVNYFYSGYAQKLVRTPNFGDIPKVRGEFYGRVSSIPKQIKDNLAYLEECRKIMKSFPNVKDMKTVCIAGFPNVGKSTLLKKLTGANPEVNSYAFTTKTLNLGYMGDALKKIQVVDTPGTLNREDRMNPIETQAYLAMKHLANTIVYIFDPTLEYSLKDQAELFRKVKSYDKPVLVYLSKTDIADESVIKELKEKYKTIEFEELKGSLL